MNPWRLVGVGVGVLLAFALVAFWMARDESLSEKSAPGGGRMTSGAIYATAFSDEAGVSQALGKWEKKLLVINFWATWCAPCLEEMPMLSQLQTEFGPKGLQIIGIAADNLLNVSNFSKKSPVVYPLLIDERGAVEFSKRLGNRLGLLPYTIIIRPGGDVIREKLGPISDAEIRELAVKYL